jgi:hypothetical protein
MKTKHVIEDLIELVRMANHAPDGEGDSIMFAARLPQTLPEAQAYVSVAAAVINAITAGPDQDAILRRVLDQANGITTTIPEPPADDGHLPGGEFRGN